MTCLRRDNAAAYVLGSLFALGGCNELLGLGPGELEESSASSLETVGAGQGGAASGSVGTGGAVGSGGGDSQAATGSTSATGGAGGADTVTSTGIGSTTASTGGAVACEPNSSIACYDGPANTMNVGLCKEGTATCDPEGIAYGPCQGQILPITESCGTSGDDDCDGSANEGCGSLTCSLYSENFDDGVASAATKGALKVDWCDTYVPPSNNTPLCMTGRTLRTNDTSIDPTLWIHQGSSGCAQAKVTFTYQQFATSGVAVQYLQADDGTQQCEKSGAFTTLSIPGVTMACAEETVTVPFGQAKAVYVRFEHPIGTNAMWVDNLSVVLEGCGC